MKMSRLKCSAEKNSNLISRSVEEGTRVPVKNALFTVESTDQESAWLVGYVEGLLEHVW